jgi:hypothetical protein
MTDWRSRTDILPSAPCLQHDHVRTAKRLRSCQQTETEGSREVMFDSSLEYGFCYEVENVYTTLHLQYKYG